MLRRIVLSRLLSDSAKQGVISMQISASVVFFVSIIASRIINERGYRKLNSDEKLRLMDGFSKTRAYSMLPLLVLIAAYYFFMTQINVDNRSLTICYFFLLVLYVVVCSFLNQRKLVQLELPADYRRMFMISQTVSFLGIACFFFVIFQDSWSWWSCSMQMVTIRW